MRRARCPLIYSAATIQHSRFNLLSDQIQIYKCTYYLHDSRNPMLYDLLELSNTGW